MQVGLLGGEPEGAEPDALRAEGEPGGGLFAAADAAGGEDGQRGDGLDDFGDQHHRADLTGVAARLVPLGDDDVDARLRVVPGVPGAPGQGGDENAVVVGAGDDVGGRGAERVGEELDRVVEGHVELAACHLLHPAGDPPAGRLPLGQLGHPVAGQQVSDEPSVPFRDHRLDVRLGDALDLLGGHDDIEAVGLAVGVPVQEVEVAFEVVGVGVADGPEHAETAGSGDRRGDLGERREAEDGVLDSQLAAQFRLHGRQDAAAVRTREEIF